MKRVLAKIGRIVGEILLHLLAAICGGIVVLIIWWILDRMGISPVILL